jgi:hypothetical protein
MEAIETISNASRSSRPCSTFTMSDAVHGELPKWPECGGLEVLILLPGCATSSSYSFM